jgi:HAMP domain-containing protein
MKDWQTWLLLIVVVFLWAIWAWGFGAQYQIEDLRLRVEILEDLEGVGP